MCEERAMRLEKGHDSFKIQALTNLLFGATALKNAPYSVY